MNRKPVQHLTPDAWKTIDVIGAGVSYVDKIEGILYYKFIMVKKKSSNVIYGKIIIFAYGESTDY